MAGWLCIFVVTVCLVLLSCSVACVFIVRPHVTGLHLTACRGYLSHKLAIRTLNLSMAGGFEHGTSAGVKLSLLLSGVVVGVVLVVVVVVVVAVVVVVLLLLLLLLPLCNLGGISFIHYLHWTRNIQQTWRVLGFVDSLWPARWTFNISCQVH